MKWEKLNLQLFDAIKHMLMTKRSDQFLLTFVADSRWDFYGGDLHLIYNSAWIPDPRLPERDDSDVV